MPTLEEQEFIKKTYPKEQIALNPNLQAKLNESITGDIFQPQIVPQLPSKPVEPNYQAITQAIPQIDLSVYQQPTQTETFQNDLSKRILEISQKFGGQKVVQAKAEETAGLPIYQKQLADVSGQIQALQKEALAIPLQIQEEFAGRGVTKGGIQPIEAGRLRQNAIKALGLSAIAQTLQGQVGLAQQQASRAVELEFAPMEAEINFLRTAYEMNKDRLNKEEKRRGEALQIQLAERERLINEQKENKKQIFDVVREAARSGADGSILERMVNAQSPEEAIGLGGFTFSAELKQKLEQQKFDRQLQETQLNLSQKKFLDDVRQFDLQYALTREKQNISQFEKLQKLDPQKSAEATSEILQDKISLIDNLINSPGFDSRVGPGRFTRGFFSVQDRFGAGQEFAAGVTQLVNKETIDTLVNLKARGGTLGALSDQERLLLQSAATKIGSWEVKDKQGNGTGRYNITEKAFKDELGRIKDLAIKAKARALGGGGFPTSEVNETDELRSAGYSDEQIRLLLEL